MKALLLITTLLLNALVAEVTRPNILWLTFEDYGPHLGCYGDAYATTPNIDQFAERAFRYTHASSNAPICAPARTTLATGMYAPALGAHHMRSAVEKPKWLKLLPELLRAEGYYCSNSHKLDYNFTDSSAIAWDESSKKAHYDRRKKGQPFFSVFNATITHESKIRNENPNPRHDPTKVTVPPYHPDLPEVRKDWAQYYDRGTEMDQWFGKQLQDLETRGLAENTIVFLFSDHGSGMPRHKRYAGWSGVHVPLLVFIPEALAHLRPPSYQAGGASSRLVSFVDFAPTVLSLIGGKPAPFHQGHRFLGEIIDPAPEFSFGFVGRADERPDSSRSVRDGRFLYLRNFMPHVPQLKGLDFQMKTPTTARWHELFEAGKLNSVQAQPWESPRAKERLFDLQADPHETKDVSQSHPEVLGRMRNALAQYFEQNRDLGLLPEPVYHQLCQERGVTPGDFARSDFYQKIVQSFTDDEDTPRYRWYSGEPENREVRLRMAQEAYLKTEKEPERGSPTFERVLLLEELLMLEPKAAYLDELIPLTDPRKYGLYLPLYAFQAIDRAPALTEKQLSRLAEIETKIPEGASRRFRPYYQDFQKKLLEKFSKN